MSSKGLFLLLFFFFCLECQQCFHLFFLFFNLFSMIFSPYFFSSFQIKLCKYFSSLSLFTFPLSLFLFIQTNIAYCLSILIVISFSLHSSSYRMLLARLELNESIGKIIFRKILNFMLIFFAEKKKQCYQKYFSIENLILFKKKQKLSHRKQ